MKIVDIINGEKPSLSFEVFPPKTSDKFDSVLQAARQIAELNPSYMSVTYGAGGTTAGLTAEICEHLNALGTTPLAHLTCVSSTKDKIKNELEILKQKGVTNILALRGDLPEGADPSEYEYKYASELIEQIRDFGCFCVGGACYPEAHPESLDSRDDIEKLKLKVESGCEFLTTQMFFDNNILYNFMYRLLKSGVNVPVVAGIMPVTNGSQIKRIMAISNSALPPRFMRIVERYSHDPEAMAQAGIAFATEQIVDLFANGINAVHVYSMNKPEVAQAIANNVSSIIK